MTLVIDIGSKYIHFIQRKNKKKLKCTSVTVPKGSIANGQIIYIEELAQIIKNTIKVQKYKKKKLTFLIHTSEVVIKTTELPKVKPKEMPVLLEQEMIGLIPDEGQYLIDYRVIESGSETTDKVMIMAMPQELAASYMQLAKRVGAKECKIDVHQNSVSKLIENQPIEEGQITVLAEIGNSMLHLHLFDGKSHIFSRSVLINTEQYRDTLILMGQLGDEEAFLKLDLSLESLEENQVLFNLINPYLTSILNEIQNMLQFQLGRASKRPVSAIYLYGGMANMKGLAKYIESGLLTPVRNIQELLVDVEVEQLNNYVSGLGEIYPDQGKTINFYKAYKQIQKRNKKLSTTTLVGSFVLAGQMIMGGSLIAYTLLAAKHNHQMAEQVILPYSQPTMAEKLRLLHTMNEEAESLKLSIAHLEEVASQVKSIQKLDKVFWEELSLQMPEGVVINQIEYQSGNMRIECEAPLEQEILDFVYHLRKLEQVQEVSYTGYQQTTSVYQFSINLVLKGGAF